MLALQDGTTVDDRYEIVGTIGSGGFGSVYKAWQKQFDRHVALKILNTNVLEETDGLLRFEREAKAISSLQHKNIVAFYGYGVWNQAPYMVMDLIEGTSLQSRLNSLGRLDPLYAARVMKQVCEGLSCAHAYGVIHRDLKPTNIMLEPGPDGRDSVKLIDFGLVKLMPGYGVPNQKLTEAGCAVGTCYYMSPEQCIGNETDHRVDIYAAACILYQAVTGERPFDKEDLVQVMYSHLNEVPKPLSDHVKGSPVIDALQAIVNKGMAKDPEDRYQSAVDMAADLDSIIRGESGKLAQQGRTSQRMVLPKVNLSTKKRSRWLFPVVAGVTAAIVAGYYFTHREEPITIDKSAIDVFEAIAERPLKPPPVPIPGEVKEAFLEATMKYQRRQPSSAADMLLQVLDNADARGYPPYIRQLTTLKLAQILGAKSRQDSRKMLELAVAHDDGSDPTLQADLQEALAETSLLQHRFANAHDIYQSLLSNTKDRHKRCLLGLARCALAAEHAGEGKAYMTELQQIMPEQQFDSRPMLLLQLSLAAQLKDRQAAQVVLNKFLSDGYEPPKDLWQEQVEKEDVFECQRALFHAGFRDMLEALQNHTDLRWNDGRLQGDSGRFAELKQLHR